MGGTRSEGMVSGCRGPMGSARLVTSDTCPSYCPIVLPDDIPFASRINPAYLLQLAGASCSVGAVGQVQVLNILKRCDGSYQEEPERELMVIFFIVTSSTFCRDACLACLACHFASLAVV